MSQHRSPALDEDQGPNSRGALRPSTQHHPTQASSRSSPARGSHPRPPPGLASRAPAKSPAPRAVAREGERRVVPGEDTSEHIASDNATERARPLRDESSFIDNFFASGETPTPSAAPGQGGRVRTAVDARAKEQTDDELMDGAKADDLGVRTEGDHVSTNTNTSASGTTGMRTPTRTQSRFSSWFHDPPQEDSDSHMANSAGSWGSGGSSESASWRRRPSDQTRREERPADESKSWRRGPPDAKLPPAAQVESSPMHTKLKEEQRKTPRAGRDRGKAATDPGEEEKKKGSRRAVAPPPGFASTGEQKRVSPPPGFGHEEPQVTPPSAVTTHEAGRVSAALGPEEMVEGVVVAPRAASSSTSDLNGNLATLPKQPPFTSGSQQRSQMEVPTTSPTTNLRTNKGRSLKNYLPNRSNAKSLPSLAASLPLSFAPAISASPFPPLTANQQSPFFSALPPHLASGSHPGLVSFSSIGLPAEGGYMSMPGGVTPSVTGRPPAAYPRFDMAAGAQGQ